LPWRTDRPPQEDRRSAGAVARGVSTLLSAWGGLPVCPESGRGRSPWRESLEPGRSPGENDREGKTYRTTLPRLELRMYKTFAAALLLVTAAVLAAQPPVTQTEAGKKALEKIRQSGALALEIAQNDNRLEVSFAQAADKLNDEQFAALKDLQGLIHLDLRALPVTDAQTVHLKGLTSLTRLHLEKTKITDKGLENLKGLVNLEYLNLYGTDVTDKGLENLQGMKKLKNLYLWQTKVTAAGADRLKKAIPGVDINLGIEEKPPEKKEPAPEKKKDNKENDKDKKDKDKKK
jgi:hypothetical protein